MTGMFFERQSSTTVPKSSVLRDWRQKRMPLCGVIAVSISQGSRPRTPAPAAVVVADVDQPRRRRAAHARTACNGCAAAGSRSGNRRFAAAPPSARCPSASSPAAARVRAAAAPVVTMPASAPVSFEITGWPPPATPMSTDARRGRHRRHRFLVHQRAAQTRERSRRVDPPFTPSAA